MPPHKKKTPPVLIRPTQHGDIPALIALGNRIYPGDDPWLVEHYASHIKHFPQGQLVAIDPQTDRVVGCASTLIINWDDYEFDHNWNEFTDNGYFTNHDPEHGKTMYAADVMVDPDMQGRGVGKAIYKARFQLCRDLNLLRIRAGARLRGYSQYVDQMDAVDYVIKVIHKDIGDPTLSFQLKRGFRVIAVCENYLRHDPASLGWAAVIEWINHHVALRRDFRKRDPKYSPRKKLKPE